MTPPITQGRRHTGRDTRPVVERSLATAVARGNDPEPVELDAARAAAYIATDAGAGATAGGDSRGGTGIVARGDSDAGTGDGPCGASLAGLPVSANGEPGATDGAAGHASVPGTETAAGEPLTAVRLAASRLPYSRSRFRFARSTTRSRAD